MNTVRQAIICSKCKRLALAFFNGMPLCPHCLTDSVVKSSDPFALGRIRPLVTARAGLKGLIKCKRNSRHTLSGKSRAVEAASFTL
jgi:hypothetical protein